ncbi:MAG TPA: hypothetical protein ENJ65_06940 [Candidatus Tenderia electrophaga]|uniref:Uncharacterized protein n=1 Tax=Candidatus Tenderia electrophaga TaxID=1748243 RepID=A0A832J5C6_9GAMM|nr:hypothetical protein [Candidatus Tenderia electrophaga]
MMKRFLFLLICLMPIGHAAEESVAVLDAEFWFMPRHGSVVAEHDGVRVAVNKLIANPDAYLALRYPDNETGELWGQELQAWLVSLGLVSDRIELQPGYEQVEGVALVVIAPDDASEPLMMIDAVVDEEAAAIVDETLPVVELATDVLPESEPVEQEDVVLEEQLELKQE